MYARIIMPTELQDEVSWLRHRIVRMRTILRFAKEARAESGLRELIAEAETRLAALEAKRHLPLHRLESIKQDRGRRVAPQTWPFPLGARFASHD